VPESSTTHRAKHSGDEHMKSELGVFNDPPNVAAIASKVSFADAVGLTMRIARGNFTALNIASKKAMPSW